MRIYLLLLCVLLSACARPDIAPMPLPAGDDLVQILRQGEDRFQSLDGEAKVGVTVDGKYFSSQQFMLLEKPDRFRTDVLSTFGQLLMQMAVDRDDLSVLLNTEVPGRFYRGAASDNNLARFTRLPVSFKDLMRLLLYNPPRISSQDLTVSSHELGVQLQLLREQGRQDIVFDRQLRPVESRYYRQNTLWLRVEYEKFSEQDGFPLKIRIEMPEQETSASVRFSQVLLNAHIPAERFIVEPPANALLEDLPN